MSEFSPQQLRKMDALVAEHVFGYQWYLFTSDKEPNEKWCGLHLPANWIERHGGKHMDHPAAGDALDIDVPTWTSGEKFVELTQRCLDQDPEHPLTLHKCFDGYCYGDVQTPHVATLPLALVIYAMRLFKIKFNHERNYQANCP